MDNAVPKTPEAAIQVNSNEYDRRSSTRTPGQMQFRAHPRDGGVVIWNPGGAWVSLDLASVRSLTRALSEWVAWQTYRFKPTGFRLVNSLTGEARTVVEGMRVTLIGDSFAIFGPDGSQLGDALPAADWSLEPINTTSTTIPVPQGLA